MARVVGLPLERAEPILESRKRRGSIRTLAQFAPFQGLPIMPASALMGACMNPSLNLEHNCGLSRQLIGREWMRHAVPWQMLQGEPAT